MEHEHEWKGSITEIWTVCIHYRPTYSQYYCYQHTELLNVKLNNKEMNRELNKKWVEHK